MFPWNIMLKIYDKEQIFNYQYLGKLLKIRTKIKPVILDLGKCNIIISKHYYKFNEKEKYSN